MTPVIAATAGVATESDVVVEVGLIEVAKGNSFRLRCRSVCCLLRVVVVVEGFVLWNRPLLVLIVEKEFVSWLSSSIVKATNDIMYFILNKLI